MLHWWHEHFRAHTLKVAFPRTPTNVRRGLKLSGSERDLLSVFARDNDYRLKQIESPWYLVPAYFPFAFEPCNHEQEFFF